MHGPFDETHINAGCEENGQLKRSMIKNAAANLSRGGAAAVVALLLPPILVRHMAPSSYAVWVLALQAAAYLGYLDFGLQTAVGRYIAFANEKKDTNLRDATFSTAVAGLSIAAVLGLFVVAAIAVAAHQIFPAIPPDLLVPLRVTMLIVGISVSLGLPASAWNGIFVGMQRYEIPAFTVGTGKLLSAAGLIYAALTGKSLVLMAIIAGAANLYTYALQFVIQRRVFPEIHFRMGLIKGPIIREVFGYCFSLTIWSFSMLLVNGFDLLLVGRFQFGAVTPYAVSATLITFLAGVQIAVFGVIMPRAAELHAQENSEALGRLLIKTTKLGVYLLLLTGLPLIVFAAPIIKVWIGSQFAQVGGPILLILAIANMVRLTGTPYASILVGTGQQRLIIVGPLMEGFSNLVASVLLGWKYGAIGVAWGTLVGAVIGMLANTLYNIPKTRNYICVSKRAYVRGGILLPAICGVPVFLAAIYFEVTGAATISLWIVSLFCAICASLFGAFQSIRQGRSV